jgi:glycosyltransferase involved in cell wall biosynthesis
MRRILFLAYHFPPVGGAGVQRNIKFARYLPEFGYEPVIVTGPGASSDRWTPVDATMREEIPEGTLVRRLPATAVEPGRWRNRAERWLGIESSWSRWWTAEAVQAGLEVGRDTDLVYASLVPYEAAKAATILARKLGKPLVVDLQDPWALDEMWVYPSAAHRRLDLGRMRRYLGAADAVVMNTPESRLRVIERFPELRRKPVVSITNGFDAADFAGDPPPSRADGIFRIVHTGYLHTELGRRHRQTARLKRVLGGAYGDVDILTRSHVYLLEAISRLVEAEPELTTNIELHLAGVLSDADRQVAGGHDVVRMCGYLSHPDTVALMRSADLLFLPMHKLPPGERAGIVPGKTYEYLASGRPILAAVPEGDARELLAEAGSALLCRPDDVDAMAGILAGELKRWRTGAPGLSPRPEVLTRFERRHLTSALAGLFDEIVPAAAARDRTRGRSLTPATSA